MGLGDVPKASTPAEEQYGRSVGRKGVAAAESDAALGVVAEEDAGRNGVDNLTSHVRGGIGGENMRFSVSVGDEAL